MAAQMRTCCSEELEAEVACDLGRVGMMAYIHSVWEYKGTKPQSFWASVKGHGHTGCWVKGSKRSNISAVPLFSFHPTSLLPPSP